ncbi:LacI family DNA-binding transcriptional regulator [Rathayibacter tanaceti]|uniref:DNA-binding LacI/PurR family transcriptional regulator n=3 Tax=Rathayibacter tanaceti TaxID=1671680 RepID=A0ACD2XJZ9_9MICO|nr:LacI family DNA-binding transcriptional regulator [Rathayibacter tanaceti]KZX22544.1 Catabolite control protein A [Rathayibacter tanaceti]TCO37401.1 DNA-binding LacI/PurR family transcriptional regulator [Rathayibacter tanaceti]
MSATMADVAELAGVSKKTVSNYFNGYPYMTAETRSRVASAITTLNYKVNISARNLSSGKTGTIALAIPEIAHPYFAELAQSVVSAAQLHGLNVVVEVTHGEHDRELALLHGESGRYVDGLLFHAIALGPEDIESSTLDVPVVLIGDRVYDGRFDFVTVANADGAYEMTRVLLGAKKRRILALGMERSTIATAAALRFEGYARALDEAGLSLEDDLLIGPIPWNRSSGATALAAALDAGVAFDAVFGFNDALALGALNELQRRGRSVPGDVSVVGFDDVEEAALSFPPLTSLDSGRNWIAERAVDRLHERLRDNSLEPEVILAEHGVVLRSSV